MNKKNNKNKRLQAYLNAIIDAEIEKANPNMELIDKCSAILDKIECGVYEPARAIKRQALRELRRSYMRQNGAKYIKFHKVSAVICACIVAVVTSFFAIKAEVCDHEWQYFARTWETHSKRCTLCGLVLRGVAHDERTVPCEETYYCSCGEFMIDSPHRTFWYPTSDSTHRLECWNPKCDFAFKDSNEPCEFVSVISEVPVKKVHEGYDKCTKCENSRRNPELDKPCTGKDCRYCNK